MRTSPLSALITSVLLLAAGHAQAQQEPASARRPALLRLGLGSSLNGNGDYPVLKASLEYAPQLGRHFRLGSRLAYIGNSKPYEVGQGYSVPQSYRAINVEQEAYWLPFGAQKTVEFGVGVGGFVGYAKSRSFWMAGVRNQVLVYEASNYEGAHVGYIVSLNLDVALTPDQRWRLGGRLALQNDTRATVLPGGQFQVSRKW